MNLNEFVNRGLQAQKAVDQVTVEVIGKSEDIAWLQQVMTNRDATPALRSAAQSRLRKVQKKRMRR